MVNVGKGGANCRASCFTCTIAPRKSIHSSTAFRTVKDTLSYSSPRAFLPLDSHHKFAINQRHLRRTEAAEPTHETKFSGTNGDKNISFSLSSLPPAGLANILTYPVDAQLAVSHDPQTHIHTRVCYSYLQQAVCVTNLTYWPASLRKAAAKAENP